jgi:divalent metal cation (Fe/Co/Zn/Cd) transporter
LEPPREEGQPVDFFFWMVSIVLIVAGIYFLLRRQWLMAVVAFVVGAIIGPIGVSLIK